MRREWRKVLAFGVFFLASVVGPAAPQEAPTERRGPSTAPVRMAIELIWGLSGKGEAQGDGSEVSVEVSAGRVIEAIAWPPRSPREAAGSPGWGPVAGGGWRLGDGGEGRARARIEAPLDAMLVVRRGDQAVSLPLAAVLDRPQHTPATAPMAVGVERLAWDAMEVDLGPAAGEGIVAPGAEVPVRVGLNILWPEATDVTVRYSAVMRPARGGEPVARQEGQEVLATNRTESAARILALRAPTVEGAYTLEVQANWDQVVREGSRLGRLIRRRKPGTAATSAVRRMSLVVLNPAARPGPAAADGGRRAREGRRGEVEVDSVDLSRSRIHRPMASGRSPLADAGRSAWAVPAEAILEPLRRDRLRDLFQRPEAEAGRLEAADGTGLAWSAVGLKAAHPDRPHRLTLTVQQGEPAALGVAMIEAGEPRPDRPRPRVLLDACASGPPVPQDGASLSFSWLVWPGSAESVLVMVNRGTDAAVRLGSVTLTELDELPGTPAVREPDASATRALGIYLDGPHALDRFGGDAGPGEIWTAANNLAAYLSSCGATAVVVPESLSDRPDRRALAGQAEEDTSRPDRLDVLRAVLERRGCSLWTELSFDGPGALPGLPPPDSTDALRRGLVRLDGRGRAVDTAYHPLHPEVRQAMRRRVVEALSQHRPAMAGAPASGSGRRPASGLVIRMGPGPTLLGTPDTGIDDATYERFVRETFSAETAREVPGRGTEGDERFDARLKYLAGAGRMPWLTWRTRAMTTLYDELAAAAQEAAPGAVLAVVTPGLDRGPAGSEARRVDLAGLTPGQAWRSVGLDLTSWPGGPAAPAVFRGVSLSSDDLAHDLATSPDLDSIVATRPRRGLLLTVDGSAPAHRPAAGTPSPQAAGAAGGEPPESPAGAPSIWLTALPLGAGASADEPLGHALAALDARWVFLAAAAAAGHEERLRRFAAVLRALPAWPASPAGLPNDPHPQPFGTVVRTTGDGTQSFLSIANDSPYPIRLACLLQAPGDALVEDLGHGFRLAPAAEAGGRNLVLDLLPFGVSAIRVGAPRVRVASLTEYPSEAVLTGMQARSHELSAQLARLNQGPSEVATEPPNPGFEPGPEPAPRPAPAAAVASGAGGEEDLPPLPGAPDPAVTTAGGVGPNAATASTLPRGWRVEASRPGAGGDEPGAATAKGDTTAPAVAIDGENPHAGRGSLRLSAPSAPASVVSDPFVPSVLSNLTIRAYFRSSPPDATVRVWIEGESAGQPYVRRSELVVPGAWEPRAVRASDLPPGGLDSARLRFELMTPGVLWLDDVRIGGDGGGKSIRLNAQRTMLAALQAYRERRYADFARLAGSHWVKQSAGLTARLARSGERPARPGQPPDASASALPSDRKLR